MTPHPRSRRTLALAAALVALLVAPSLRAAPKGGAEIEPNSAGSETATDARNREEVARRSAAPKAKAWTARQIRDAALTATRTASAESTALAILEYLGNGGDPAHAEVLRWTDIQARYLVGGHSSVAHNGLGRLLAEVRGDTLATIGYILETAQRIADQLGADGYVKSYGNRILNLAPKLAEPGPFAALAWGYLGRYDIGASKDSAIARLERSTASAADRPRLLRWLGRAYEDAGRTDDALNAYLASLGAYPGTDSTAREAAQKLWSAKHGGLEGYGARVAEERTRGERISLIELRRFERDAKLDGLVGADGRPFDAATLAGKPLVVMLWRPESGPSRRALETLRAISASGAANTLALAAPRPFGTPEERRAKCAEFLAAIGYKGASACDLGGDVARALGAGPMPTTFVIEGGRVRYRELGEENLRAAIDAQLASLTAR